MKPAIVAVGYNRPDLMKRLLESVGAARFHANDITLIVSIDESDRSDEVEAVAKEFRWIHGEKIVRRFPERQGLRKHIVSCGDLSEKYGAVIILEDDLVVSEDFYSYTCAAHKQYSHDTRICGVSLYSFAWNQFNGYPFTPMQNGYDVYLGGMVVTWGQSWTKEQWISFKKWYLEHEDKLPLFNHSIPDEISGWTRSWGRYFASYMADKNKYYVYPYLARSTCYASLGEHSVNKLTITSAQTPLIYGECDFRFGEIDELVCYDCFYERILSSDIKINGISADEICMDLNGMKKSAKGYRYLLTCSSFSYREIATYDLAMKPIEINVIHELNGDYFHLYELPVDTDIIRQEKKKKYNYEFSYRRSRYNYLDMVWKTAIRYGCNDFFVRLKAKLSK